MSDSLSMLLRYVADTDPPTLLKRLESEIAGYQEGQEEGFDVAASIYRQVFYRKPETIRQMLSHERPLPLFEFELIRRFCGLTVNEATALYMANAPAEEVGMLVRAHEIGGPHEVKLYCSPPPPFVGLVRKGDRRG